MTIGKRYGMKAMCDDIDGTFDEWPNVVMDGIFAKTHEQKKVSVRGMRYATRVFLLLRWSNYVSVKGTPNMRGPLDLTWSAKAAWETSLEHRIWGWIAKMRRTREINVLYNNESVVLRHSRLNTCDGARRRNKGSLVILMHHMTEAWEVSIERPLKEVKN